MTDKELLEAAAKAAGYAGFDWLAGPECLNVYYEDGTHEYFDPLGDDGDALRLAVKLRMDVDISDNAPGDSTAWAMASGDVEAGEAEYLGDDPYAATRRAIVRAAAALVANALAHRSAEGASGAAGS